MVSTLIEPLDSLTESMLEEPSWASTESTEGIEDQSEAPKLLPRRKLTTPRIRVFTMVTSGTSAFTTVTSGTSAFTSVTSGTSAFQPMVHDISLAHRSEVARQLFSSLIKARGDRRDRIYEALLHLAEPEIILDVALDEYHRYGNEERLAMAASLLADIGAPALPALRILVSSGRPDCEMFIPIIARLRGVSVQSRLALLAQVASNTSTDVRYGLLEALRAFAPHEVIPLLRTLSRDEDTDIADEARAWLESLEAESQKG
jgi:hypothetical protein